MPPPGSKGVRRITLTGGLVLTLMPPSTGSGATSLRFTLPGGKKTITIPLGHQ